MNDAAEAVRELRADNGVPEDLWNRAECVAVIPGLILRAEIDANAKVYSGAAIHDVLFGGAVPPPPAADTFLRTLREESRATTGRER